MVILIGTHLINVNSMDNLIDLLRKEREVKGELKHGPLDLKNDRRDFIQEATEELLDSLNYLSWAFEKGQLNPDSYLKIDRDLRDATAMLLRGKDG